MAKILLVMRVSTNEQDTKSQRDALKKHLISKGLNEEEFMYLEEEGASAIKLNDKYLHLISRIKKLCLDKVVDTVAFWHLNRLGRKEKVLIEMKEFFIEHNIQVYIKEPDMQLLNEDKTENVSTGLLWSMFAVMIKGDTKELQEKLQRGKEHKKELGLYTGGKLKKGYHIVDGVIREHPEDSDTIRKIREMYATGDYSARTLFNELKSRGVMLGGDEIHYHTVVTVLTDEYANFADSLTNERIRSTKTLLNSFLSKSRAYHLLERLIICPYCGCHLIYKQGLYGCQRKYRSFENVKCEKGSSIKGNEIESVVWGSVCELDHRKHLILRDEEIAKMSGEINLHTTKIEVATRELPQLEKRKSKVIELFIDGVIDKSERDRKLAKVDGEINEINTKIEYHKNAIDVITNKIKLSRQGNVKVDYDSLDNQEKQLLVRKHIKEIRLIEREKFQKMVLIVDKYGSTHRFTYNAKGKPKWTDEGIVTTIYNV